MNVRRTSRMPTQLLSMWQGEKDEDELIVNNNELI